MIYVFIMMVVMAMDKIIKFDYNPINNIINFITYHI